MEEQLDKMPSKNVGSYVQVKRLLSPQARKKSINEVAEFIKPEYED